MTFLNPLFLFGLAAAAIPLVIHLFNFRRPRRVEFSSLAFLEELQKSTMQRVRIKQWLLLALRTLAILFLVLSFARPTMTGPLAGSIGGGKTSSAIVLDNSRSMLLRDGAGAYIEQVRAVASGLIDRMESGDEVFLVPTVSAGETSTAFQNRAAARAALMTIEADEGEMSLVESIAQAAQLLSTSANPNRDVYVLTDLQRSTLGDSLDVVAGGEASVFVIPIGTREHDNVAVTDVAVLSRILSVGQVVRMEAVLSNYAERPTGDLVVSLYLDDERVSQATASLGPGGVARVPIALTPRSTGWLAGSVEIEDDEFRDDNVHRFTLFIPEERQILLVGGTGVSTAYVELALSGDVTGSGVRFVVDRVDETGLSTAGLGGYDTVILSGVNDLSSGERGSLAAYVRDGGGLLIFPGDDARLEDYNALLADLGGGSVEDITDPGEAGTSIAGFGNVDVEHPLFEGLFAEEENRTSTQLEQPDIRRLMRYRPGAGSEQSLIRLTNDRSFLQEIRHELGSVLIYAVAPEESWSDFPVRGLFVPLLYRSIYYLSAGASVAGESFISAQAARLRLTGVQSESTVSIEAVNGDAYVPELRRTPGGVVAQIGAGFLQTGIYNVLAADETVRRIAVNPAPAESRLATIDTEEAAERLAASLGVDVRLLDITGSDLGDIESRLSEARTGVELWNVFLVLALFTLLAEMIVERNWRPEAA